MLGFSKAQIIVNKLVKAS